ncbi:MAG: M23 family metallopeptidase, partial [bacterium]
MTSSFGEFRPGHIHAGLDVKTWGRIGVPMLAVSDGWIRRVRTSPWGYGKALYLQLLDGRTAVYAHLDRFTDGLEERVWAQQVRAGRYSVDVWFEEGVFPVSSGDVVAFSGQTGTSAPHLHFELRDDRNAPLNPLRNGLRVEDTLPPVITYLVVRPVGAGSRVEGDIRVRRFGRRVRGDAYLLQGRPEIEGEAALALAAYDRMDGVWNRFSPYRLTLLVDGEQRFEVRYDRFSYEGSGLIDLDRDYRYRVREGVQAHTLYRQEGNDLPFYGDVPEGAGYLKDLSPGIHRITVVAADASGNESRLEGEVLVNRAPVLTEVNTAGTDPRPDQLRFRVTDPDGDAMEVAAQVLRAAADGVEGGGPAGPRNPIGLRETIWTDAPGGWLQEEEDGLYRVGPGESDQAAGSALAVRITARDRWGRTTVGEPCPLPGVSGRGGYLPPDVHLEVERYEGFLRLFARTAPDLPGRLRFFVRQEGLLETVTPGRKGQGGFEGVYALRQAPGVEVRVQARFEPLAGPSGTAEKHLRIRAIGHDSGARFISADGGLTLSVPEGALYSRAFIQEMAPPTAAGGGGDQGLVPLSPVYAMGPEDLPFRGRSILTLRTRPLPEGVEAEQTALYTRSGPGGRWVHLGGALRGDRLEARVGGLGP